MADLEKIAEDLSSLTELEAADLAKLLEEKWGVSASAPVAVAATAGAGETSNSSEAKTEFSVSLTAVGDKKIMKENPFEEYIKALSAISINKEFILFKNA